MRTAFIIYAGLILTLTSCEGFVHMQGYVFDKETKKPIQNAQALLILQNRDTLRDIYFEYDTISYNKRIALRKSGVKDDYDFYSAGGLSKKPTLSVTNTNGYFSVGTILVPCVPKCPTCQLIFFKDGYKQLTLKLSSIVNDNINISLERLTDSTLSSTTRN